MFGVFKVTYLCCTNSDQTHLLCEWSWEKKEWEIDSYDTEQVEELITAPSAKDAVFQVETKLRAFLWTEAYRVVGVEFIGHRNSTLCGYCSTNWDSYKYDKCPSCGGGSSE